MKRGLLAIALGVAFLILITWIGTFLASGFFHECTILAMGHEWDSRVPLFFLMQGGSVIGERIWRKTTGRRVGGFLGRMWVYFDIIILGQPLGKCFMCPWAVAGGLE